MISAPLGELLRELLTGDPALIPLRNDEGLPDRMLGTDLDVSIGATQTLDGVGHRIANIAERLGWTPVFVNRRSYMVAIPLAAVADAQAIHLDVFDGIGVLGVQLVAPTLLEQESHSAVVRRLSERAVVLVTLVHHLCWNGGFNNPDYFAKLDVVLDQDRPWLEGQLRQVFGSAFARDICSQPHELSGAKTQRRRRAMRLAVGRRLFTQPGRTLGALARYLGDHLVTFWKPTGLIARVGASLPGTDQPLTLELACRLEPHSFAIPHVRADGAELRSANGDRYEQSLRRRWAKSRWLRVIAPSLYLWVQAKRGEVVILQSLPPLVRFFERTTNASWISV